MASDTNAPAPASVPLAAPVPPALADAGEKGKLISPIEERLISILKDGGPLTRDQLVKKMDVPRTTIFDGLKKLIQRDEVKKYPFYETQRSRGRPQVMFSLLDDKK
jgi:predicted ArsR family transcriptional regulator